MSDNATAATDNIVQAYAKLGLSPEEQRTRIAAAAEDILRIAPNSAPVTAEEIDVTVMRMANSPYAKLTNRLGIVSEAYIGGVFTEETGDFIELDARKTNVFLNDYDIRKGIELLEHAPTEMSDVISEENREYIGTIPLTPKERQFLLRELALVSAVCQAMPDSAFDPRAAIKLEFKRSGVDFDIFDAAFKRPAFRSAVKALGKPYE